MNPSQILMYALVIILFYLIYTYLISTSSNKLTGILSARTPYVVSEDSIKLLNNSQQIFNYTVSIWIYVDNWDITTNLTKPILTIEDALDVYLGSIDNNLFVNVHKFSSTVDKFTAVIPAVPLQAWTNIAVSIHDTSVDIYMNGKLVQSNLMSFLPGPVKESIKLTPEPGFIGWTSNFEYYPYALNPTQINDVYKKGYTGAQESLLNLLGRYSMKVVFVDNTQKQ
jgi:hypothetical protein